MSSAPTLEQDEKEPRTLTPANAELKKKLPHFSRRASEKPNGDNEVNAVYPNALEICGMGVDRGGGVFMGILSGIFLMFPLSSLFTEASEGSVAGTIFMAVFSLIIITAMTPFLRFALFTYRDEPTLINRATRKVHIFQVKRISRKKYFQ